MIGDTLTALVAADPGGAEQFIPDEARAGVFDEWQVDEATIFARWSALTDPANLQPDAPKALRDASVPWGRNDRATPTLSLHCLGAHMCTERASGAFGPSRRARTNPLHRIRFSTTPRGAGKTAPED